VPGIDLIIGGHTHVVLEQPEVVNGVPILQAGSHARYFGHAQVTLGRDGMHVESYALHTLQEARK
jgi:5'-nucleotidase